MRAMATARSESFKRVPRSEKAGAAHCHGESGNRVEVWQIFWPQSIHGNICGWEIGSLVFYGEFLGNHQNRTHHLTRTASKGVVQASQDSRRMRLTQATVKSP